MLRNHIQTMKKLLGILALLGAGTMAFAQPSLKIGPEVGITYTNMSQRLEGVNRATNFQLGYRLGANLDLQFTDHFFMQAGLFLSGMNGSESFYEDFSFTGAGTPISYSDRRQYSVTYLQVPVYAMLKTGKEYDDRHFFFGVGPYIAAGIGGNYKQTYSTTLNGVERPQNYDHSLLFGNDRDKDQVRPFDLGAAVIIGFEAPFGLYFKAQYSIGLLNIAPDGDSDHVFRNQAFGLSVGYLFPTSHRSSY